MINFAYPCRMISVIPEVLGPCAALANLRARALVSESSRGMGIISRHEAGPRRATISSLTVCLSETGTFRGQFVDIGCLADLVAVAGQGGRSQVIRDDEEDVWLFRASE